MTVSEGKEGPCSELSEASSGAVARPGTEAIRALRRIAQHHEGAAHKWTSVESSVASPAQMGALVRRGWARSTDQTWGARGQRTEHYRIYQITKAGLAVLASVADQATAPLDGTVNSEQQNPSPQEPQP